jgi:tripartite-type tricarboxylate transporter receptor subunit TctC
MPGVPPVADSGLPGYESIVIFGAFAPAGTPRNVIDRLNSEIVRFLSRHEVKERLFNSGLEIVGGSPEQFAVTVRSELLRMGVIMMPAYAWNSHRRNERERVSW